MSAAVKRFGRLDALVNNASVRRQTQFAEMTPEEWREIMGTTLDGAFYCAHAAAPHIVAAGGGSIVNLVVFPRMSVRSGGCMRSPRNPAWWG